MSTNWGLPIQAEAREVAAREEARAARTERAHAEGWDGGQTMNVYYCDAGDGEAWRGSGSYDPPEYARVCDVVIAHTRGQARALFVAADTDFMIEFKDPMSIRKIGTVGADVKPQVVRDETTELGRQCWAMMSPRHIPDDPLCECEQCNQRGE